MKTTPLLLLFVSCLIFSTATAQTKKNIANYFPQFSQHKINSTGKNFKSKPSSSSSLVPQKGNKINAFAAITKMDAVKKLNPEKFIHGISGGSRSDDTVYVGGVPHDTLVITGTYTHTGPILVFNDGVLIFDHAVVTNYGDVYAFQHGRILGISSDLTFPQTYFYQRSLIVVQNGIAYFNDCNFNYSGMQHNLVIGDSAQVGMENVHQNDWTTAGIYGGGILMIHGMNLGGEYILTDSSNCYFSNVDTLLLWHKMPATAVINYAFPNGDTVMSYQFNNTVSGVSGINYHVFADSCTTVWWAMMPVNGSDVTISDSDIRAIGCWFQHGDSTAVTGVFDNTVYADSVLPFGDRNIRMINTDVKTWNLYAFDSSFVNVTNSAVGEIGTQQTSQIVSDDFLLDGSGGYFWATDTSGIIASNVTVYSTTRSERHGIFVLSYSLLPYSVPTSIGTSLFVSVQNALPADPIAYDGSAMWMQSIESPATAHADSLIQIKGSAWIDQGPMGNPIDFLAYNLYYQLEGTTEWMPIVLDSTSEIRHNVLGKWNTTGLTPGNYTLRLFVQDNMADTVEDFTALTLLPSLTTGIQENKLSAYISPNPASEVLNIYFSENNSGAIVKIYNVSGQTEIVATSIGIKTSVDTSALPSGIYFVEIKSADKIYRERFIKN